MPNTKPMEEPECCGEMASLTDDLTGLYDRLTGFVGPAKADCPTRRSRPTQRGAIKTESVPAGDVIILVDVLRGAERH